MAGSPEWKVFDTAGAYQAACKEGEAAACLVALYGSGAKIKHGHSLVVWTEGSEAFSAGDSYDGCATLIAERRYAAYRAGMVKIYGEARVAEMEAKGSPA